LSYVYSVYSLCCISFKRENLKHQLTFPGPNDAEKEEESSVARVTEVVAESEPTAEEPARLEGQLDVQRIVAGRGLVVLALTNL